MKELFDAIVGGAATCAMCKEDGVRIALYRSDSNWIANVEDHDGTASFTAVGLDPVHALRALARSVADTMAKKADELAGRGTAFSIQAASLRLVAGAS